MYSIRSGNSSINKYCFAATIANYCKGIPGRWKRIAYLNTDTKCPDGFEVRNDTSIPPLCRRMNTSAGCSSVIYPSNGTSYSQACGTVRVHLEGTPDGFAYRNFLIQHNGQSVNQNYADGVSLTYGDSSNRNHIWTYTAATAVGDDGIGCGNCNNNDKPNIPGTNLTCTNAYCGNDISCAYT